MTASWFLSHLALTAGFMLAVVLIAHIIRQRRPPTATLAWLLIIVLVPYLGVPLYLFLGGRKMRNLAGRKSRIKLTEGAAPAPHRLSSMEQLLCSHGIPPATVGNRLQLQPTGEGSYAALADLIENARRSIYVEIFSLYLDPVGEDILARLTRRAAEGIRVRLLLDGVGSLHTHRRTLAPLLEAGGRFAFFIPVIHRPFRGRSNLRNHRKIVVVDEKRVLAGGANIAREYMGPVPWPGRWRDLTFTLEGPGAIYYLDLFRSDWGFASGEWITTTPELYDPSADPDQGAIAQIVPSGPDVPGDPFYDALLTAVFSARRRLWVVTPYFVPDDALCRALMLAAHRGVDVRILVPQRSNHRLADVAGRSYLREIESEGGTVLFFRGGMLHAKAVLMDDELAIIGSANIDMRSLLLNYEVGMFLYSAAEIRFIAGWMDGLARESGQGMGKVGAAGQLGEGLARLLAPQL